MLSGELPPSVQVNDLSAVMQKLSDISDFRKVTAHLLFQQAALIRGVICSTNGAR